MAIPKYFEMYRSFLRALADGGVHPYADVKKQVIADAGLSDEEVAALLPSGNQTIFNNRIGWCRTYLKKAGLIESPTRAHFLITDTGKRYMRRIPTLRTRRCGLFRPSSNLSAAR